MPVDSIHCLLISDFTINGLAPYLADGTESPAISCTAAPFDQVVQVLLDSDASCWSPKPDLAVVWTRPQRVITSFARLLEHETVSSEDILAEVDSFGKKLREAAKRVPMMFIPTWTWPAYDRGLGLLSLDTKTGPGYHLLRMNIRLAETVAGARNIYLLDGTRWLALAGETGVSPKLWHLGKIAFGVDVYKHAARDIKAGVRALKGQSRKLIILDLDDTLWGGIVGDVGWQNLALGGHDPVGEAFRAFQRALKTLTRRGIVLGIVSKNTEEIALEAIDRHPEMVLRRDDFVGWRINWQDKARNVIDLVNELNLGLQSVVFIDDSPAERARVREALPDVLVPEWPEDKLYYEKALTELNCFDTAGISVEDQGRTAMYVSDRRRNELKQQIQSLEEYLVSLDLRITCERLGSSNLSRAVQLFNKTNQLNLTTRRMTGNQLLAWSRADGNYMYVFRVKDRFGDYGLTGIASLTIDGTAANVADFILSCRVMGRGVEQAILHCLSAYGREAGAAHLIADYRPTAQNTPCKEFFAMQSGLTETGGENRYVWSSGFVYPAPKHIFIEFEEGKSGEFRAEDPSSAAMILG
jgi:FkbH-like protein